jgi:hypothetical protein
VLSDCDFFAAVEEGVCCYRVVDFGFEDGDEAGFAELRVVFWSHDEGAVGCA